LIQPPPWICQFLEPAGPVVRRPVHRSAGCLRTLYTVYKMLMSSLALERRDGRQDDIPRCRVVSVTYMVHGHIEIQRISNAASSLPRLRFVESTGLPAKGDHRADLLPPLGEDLIDQRPRPAFRHGNDL